MTAIDFIQYSERMVGEASPDYSDTLNRALKTVVSVSGADEDAFVGFALRPVVAPTVGQFYRATDTGVGASWQTLTTAMISDLTSASTGITKVGTVNTGVWQGTSIATTYTDAKIKTVTGTTDRLTIGGTSTDPTFDIAATYAGQTSIVTLGTVTTGSWTATSIATAYTDAKVVSLSGTANRVTVGGTANVPVIDISAAYVGQTSIVTLGTVTTGTWTGTSIGTAYTDAKVVSISGTASRVTVGGTATVPVIDISAAYIGQSSITTLGTITTGVWHGTSIDTTYTDAKLKTLTGTLNRLTVGGTATDPTVDISVSYVGQATITTLGTIVTGSWTATSISTTYTDAKVKTVTGTANRLTIGGTATDPTFDVSTSYVGQATITTLGTITTGTWAATAITVDKGGTNIASFTIGDMIFASGATTLSKLAIGTAAQILVTNGGATAPAWHTLATADITDLTSASTGITKVGTVTTGVWNAGIINGIYGGTGVNNGSSTITLGGSLTTSGAFALTLTVTAGTNVTLPTTGTLVTTAVTSLASLTSVGGAFAISGAFTGATTGAFSSTLTVASTLQVTNGRILVAAGSVPTTTGNNSGDIVITNNRGLHVANAANTTSYRGLRLDGSDIWQIDTDARGVVFGGAVSGITTLATSSTINSQTISSAANFTGSLTAATVLSGGGLRATGTSTAASGAGFELIYSSGSILQSYDRTGAQYKPMTFNASSYTFNLQEGGTSVAFGSGAITAGTYNGQTISSAASFTGTLLTAGNITVTKTGVSTIQSGGTTGSKFTLNIAGVRNWEFALDSSANFTLADQTAGITHMSITAGGSVVTFGAAVTVVGAFSGATIAGTTSILAGSSSVTSLVISAANGTGFQGWKNGAGTQIWALYSAAGSTMSFRDSVNSIDVLNLVANTGITVTGSGVFTGDITSSAGILIAKGAAGNVGAGAIGYGGTVQTTVGAAGGASALPATPTGYIIINVNGTNRVIPYYAAS